MKTSSNSKQFSPRMVRTKPERKCTRCRRKFDRVVELAAHLRSAHPEIFLYKCSYCPSIFNNEKIAWKHERTMHSGRNTTRCKYCSSSFNKVASLKWHTYVHHTDHNTSSPRTLVSVRAEPKSANKTKAVKMLALRNSSMQTPESLEVKPKSARKRSKTAKESPTTKNNTQIIHANKFSCSYCPKSLSTMWAKVDHERFHTGDKKYSCKFCKATFHHKYAVDKHESECSSLADALWCQFCDYHSLLSANLERHYVYNHGFTFQSDAEKDFLDQKIRCTSTIQRDMAQKHESEISKRQEGSEIEDEILQSQLRLVEIFRDNISWPETESSEGTVPGNDTVKDIPPSNDSSSACESLNSQSSEGTMLQDSVESDSQQREPIVSEKNTSDVPRDNRQNERESLTSHFNDNVEEMLQDIFEPNSKPSKDPASEKNPSDEALVNNETTELANEISQLNDDLRSTEISQLNDDLDGASPNDTLEPSSEDPKSAESPKDAVIEASAAEEEPNQLATETLPPNDEQHQISQSLTTSDENPTTETSQPDDKQNEISQNSDENSTADISCNNVTIERENEDIPLNDEIHLELSAEKCRTNAVELQYSSSTQQKDSGSGYDSDPDFKWIFPPQNTENKEFIEEKLLKYENEVAQLDNNLREIFQKTETIPKTSYRVIDLTENDEESLPQTSCTRSNKKRKVSQIDLTADSDDDFEVESTVLLIDDDFE